MAVAGEGGRVGAGGEVSAQEAVLAVPVREQHLLTALGLTPHTNPLTPARRTRRTFEQTVQLLELFLHREGRPPAARESIRVDGDTVKIGAWFAKARTEHRTGQLPEAHAHLIATLFDGDWTTEHAVPAAMA
ncbi:hypothetical protein ACIHJG_38820 [Streptomyces sp. NPDC052415]|uniref:hypothetical protein n=1 Tax=Streptomyces sp. NPDC052415 TaxID=3365690 RepID=UPI0037D8D6B2